MSPIVDAVFWWGLLEQFVGHCECGWCGGRRPVVFRSLAVMRPSANVEVFL